VQVVVEGRGGVLLRHGRAQVDQVLDGGGDRWGGRVQVGDSSMITLIQSMQFFLDCAPASVRHCVGHLLICWGGGR